MKQVIRFEFNKNITKEDIEDLISTAVITAECTFGEAKVRINAGYLISGSKAVVDVSSKVGEHIAEVFTGLITKKFGEESFYLERVRDESH